MAKNAKDFEERPWGTFQVIGELKTNTNGDVVVKIMTIRPGKRVSYQKHQFRSEHWHIVQGEGFVTLDDEKIPVTVDSKIHIPILAKHRITNTHDSVDLIFIETIEGQFDEYDNERLEDDFERDSSWRNT